MKVATTNEVTVIFKENKSQLGHKSGTKFKIHVHKRLYYLMTVEDHKNTKNSCRGCYHTHSWQKILSNCNYDNDVKLRDAVDGMKIKGTDTSNRDYEICIKGKFSQSRNRQPDTQATSILQLVHTDQAEPIEPADLNGNKYTVSFTDDSSGVVFVYFTKNKGDAALATEKFIADSSPNGKIKILRSDNGLEFNLNDFLSLLRRNDIKHATSSPH